MAQAVLRKRGGEVVVHLLMEERAARALQSGELARLVRTRAALRIESLLQRAFRAHSRLQRASNNKKAAAGLPRRLFESMIMKKSVLCRPGNDLLFRVLRRSTIGAGEFKRSSSGWDRVWTPRTQSPGQQRTKRHQPFGWRQADKMVFLDRSCRTFRPQWTSNTRAIKPIERLVPVSFTHCCAYTPGLSTWWSTTALKGVLVLRWVSRLDAFSGYPVRT